jgi:hypothetical protein
MVTYITWDTTTYVKVWVLLVTGLRKEEKTYVLEERRNAVNMQKKKLHMENTKTDDNCPVGTITF